MECTLILPVAVTESELADRIAWESWWSLAREWRDNGLHAGTFDAIRQAAADHLAVMRRGEAEDGPSRRVHYACEDQPGIEGLILGLTGTIVRRLPTTLEEPQVVQRLIPAVGRAVRDVLNPYQAEGETFVNPVAPRMEDRAEGVDDAAHG